MTGECVCNSSTTGAVIGDSRRSGSNRASRQGVWPWCGKLARMASGDADAIEAAVAAIEAQRSILGDAVTDVAIGALLDRLAGDQASPHHPRLRPATVLFADVVGSTSIGATLDPEDIHVVMDRIAVEFTRRVTARFGTVVKYTGDGLLAVFGVENAAEQAPELAVRAGLDMLDAMTTIRADLERQLVGRPLDARVGVHTGLVLVGGGVEGASNIRGTAVNVAARMEQTAPPGGMRISDDTYRLVRGIFDVVTEPPVSVQGLDEPIQTHVVTGVRPTTFRVATRGIDGLVTNMVGRGADLAVLQESFRAITTASTARWHLVVGDAGLGKSRLLHEFHDWARALDVPFHALSCRAQLDSSGAPYRLLRDLLVTWLRADHADDQPLSPDAFVVAVEPLLGASATSFLAEVLGFVLPHDPIDGLPADALQDVRLRVAREVARLIRALYTDDALGAPVVVLLEDLHWADDATLEVIEHVLRVDTDVGALVIGTARPELLEARPSAVSTLAGAEGTRLELGPLGDADAGELVDALLSPLDHVPVALRRQIVLAGDGVPFFLEEVVRMLVDSGTLGVHDDRWSLDETPEQWAVPDTLAGVLQARLDSLPPDELAVAQRAAVIGHVFWSEGIGALGGSEAALGGLVARGLVVHRPLSSVPGLHEFAFRHHLLHQFVYDSLLKSDRRSHHAATAAWLESVAAGLGDRLAIIAEHHERAGSAADAVAWFVRAAEDAAQRDAGRTVVELTARALALVDQADAPTRWQIVAVRERALTIGDELDLHRADLDELARLADALDRDDLRAEAACRLARSLNDRGDYADALAAATRAIELVGGSGDGDELLARAESQAADAHWRLGRHQLAVRYAEQAMRRPLAPSSAATAIDITLQLGVFASFLDDHDRAAELAERALSMSRSIGYRLGEAAALKLLGVEQNLRGLLDAALELYSESVAVSRDVGWLYGEAIALLNVAITLLDLGRFEESIAQARVAADTASLGGIRDLESASECTIGFAALELGQPDVARRAFSRSHELFRLNGSEHYTLSPTMGLAALDAAEGDADRALSRAREVADHLDRGGTLTGLDYPLHVAYHAHRILRTGGDPRAETVLVEGMRLLDAEPGPRPFAPDDVGSWDRRRLAAVWQDLQASRLH